MDTYFVILEFHLQAGFEDAALIVEEALKKGFAFSCVKGRKSQFCLIFLLIIDIF
jgi:hypothetical protein